MAALFYKRNRPCGTGRLGPCDSPRGINSARAAVKSISSRSNSFFCYPRVSLTDQLGPFSVPLTELVKREWRVGISEVGSPGARYLRRRDGV